MNLPDPSTTRDTPRATPQGSPTPENIAIFEAFENYRFSDDPDFRAGLPTVVGAMRGTKRSAAQIDEMMGRAQWFYFTRLKHVNLPWESYRAWSTATPSHSASFTPSSCSSSPSASSHSRSPTPHHARPKDPLAVLNNLAEAKKMMDAAGTSSTGGEGMSFSMLCRLISEGRADEVPVKQIPDQLNTSPPSDSLLPTRLKPWEQPPNSAPHSAPTFPATQISPPLPGFFSQSNSTPSLHNSPRNSISINHSPRPSYIHQSPPFDPSSLYRQNSSASSSSLHSLPSVPLPMKQNPSPPGTSSSFNNPSLAPSPPSLPSPLSPNSNPFDFNTSPFGLSASGNLGTGMDVSTGLGLRNNSTDFSAFQALSMDPAGTSSDNTLPSGFAMSPFTYPTPGGLFGEGITPKDESIDPLAVGVGPETESKKSHSGDVLNLGF